MPSATVWRAVAEILTSGLSNLPVSAQWAALTGGLIGIVFEAIKFATKGRFWISGVAMGLAFVIPFNTCLSMFLGGFFFWVCSRRFKDDTKTMHTIFVKNLEPICAGLIAGGALMGIFVMVVAVLV